MATSGNATVGGQILSFVAGLGLPPDVFSADELSAVDQLAGNVFPGEFAAGAEFPGVPTIQDHVTVALFTLLTRPKPEVMNANVHQRAVGVAKRVLVDHLGFKGVGESADEVPVPAQAEGPRWFEHAIRQAAIPGDGGEPWFTKYGVTRSELMEIQDRMSVALGGTGSNSFTRDIGRVPLGQNGLELIAWREIFRLSNGHFPEILAHLEIGLIALRHVDRKKIALLKANLAAVQDASVLPADEILTAGKIDTILDQNWPLFELYSRYLAGEEITADLASFDCTTTEQLEGKVLAYLTLQEKNSNLREAAVLRLRAQAASLIRAGKTKFVDTLYLLTYDTATYPATTTNTGELKYIIVADKGEMGARIAKEAVAKGLIPVVIHNEDDRNSMQMQIAESVTDPAKRGFGVFLGRGSYKELYKNYELLALRIEHVFKQRFPQTWRAELDKVALHPGYGPLAENDAAIGHFRRSGIIFCGPMEDVVLKSGDKGWFRSLVQKADPEAAEHLTRGIRITKDTLDEMVVEVKEAVNDGVVGLPLRAKARNGGGGRGQRVVELLDSLRGSLSEIEGEITANGWAPGMMVEDNIPDTIHLEIQVLRDRYGNTRTFGMRDCSEQRNDQKIQEEAPPAILQKHPGLQDKMEAVAAAIADLAGYVGAATVELMFKDGKFFWLEMNTRIQVEHCITELVTDINGMPLNLVQLQMDIANGKAIEFEQADINQNWFGRNYRINSEIFDPTYQKFSPVVPNPNPIGDFKPNRNYLQFQKLHTPTAEQVLLALQARYPLNETIAGMTAQDIMIRLDSGYGVGDILPNDRDPTFAKFMVVVRRGIEDVHEIQRLTAIEALKLFEIKAKFVSVAGNSEAFGGTGCLQQIIQREAEAAFERRTDRERTKISDEEKAAAVGPAWIAYWRELQASGDAEKGVSTYAVQDISGFGEPFFNISDHIRVLESRMMRDHVRGVDKGRHVRRTQEIFRKGESLDTSHYPALMRASTEPGLEVPVVYAVHRSTPVYHVPTPEVFTSPENYSGLLAAFIAEKKRVLNQKAAGQLSHKALLAAIFGCKETDFDSESRVAVSIDEHGQVINLVLYRGEVLISTILTLETMNCDELLQLDLSELQYSLAVVIGKNLTAPSADAVVIKFGEDRKGVGALTLGGREFTLQLDVNPGQASLALRNSWGEQLIKIRPHQGSGLVRQYLGVVAQLARRDLSVGEVRYFKERQQALFVDMVIQYGSDTESRRNLILKLAQSPYNMTTVLAELCAFEHSDSDLAESVRSTASEALFYRYYETRYHHVDRYNPVSDERGRFHLATFSDDNRATTMVQATQNRNVVMARVESAGGQEEVTLRRVMHDALDILKGNGPDSGADVLEIWTPQYIASDDDFAIELKRLCNEVVGSKYLRRITFGIYRKTGSDSFVPGEGFFTFRPTGGGVALYEESTKFDPRFEIVPRHEHPMVSEQMERWRWQVFESRNIKTNHRQIQVTEVTARANKADKRLVVDAQIRKRPTFMKVEPERMNQFLAFVKGFAKSGQMHRALIDTMQLNLDQVPADLPQRLIDLVKWKLCQEGGALYPRQDAVHLNVPLLYKQGKITDIDIVRAVQSLEGMVFYSPEIELVVEGMAAELGRAGGKATFNSRLGIFIQTPCDLPKDYVSFLAMKFSEPLWSYDIEKLAFHVVDESGRQQVMTVRGLRTAQTYREREVTISVVAPSQKLVVPKSAVDLKKHSAILTKGNLALTEKLAVIFDPDSSYQELVIEDGFVKEIDPITNPKSKNIRAFIGVVGGRRTYVISADPENKENAFDSPEGRLIKTYIDHSYTERDDLGRTVGAPVIKIEELSAGANLFKPLPRPTKKTPVADDPNWAGTDPLDSFGEEFDGRYRHAAFSGRPNLTAILDLVVGGGIYGPMASHEVIALEALSVAALTGGDAAAYATGAVARIINGDLKAEGGTFKFDHNVSGSSQSHGQNGVFNTVATIQIIMDLLASGMPIEEVKGKLTAIERRLLQIIGLEEVRRSTLILDDNLAPLLGSLSEGTLIEDQLPPHTNDPIAWIKSMAISDEAGQPVFKLWSPRMADDLVCGWIALPVTQADGTVRVQSVAVMLQNPQGKNGGKLSHDAYRKAEEFIEINRRLGRALIRGIDFTRENSVEGGPKDIEDYRIRALAQLSTFNGVVVSLPKGYLVDALAPSRNLVRGSLEQGTASFNQFVEIEDRLAKCGIPDFTKLNYRRRDELLDGVMWIERAQALASLLRINFSFTPDGKIVAGGVTYSPLEFLQIFGKALAGQTLGTAAAAGTDVLVSGSDVVETGALLESASALVVPEMNDAEVDQLRSAVARAGQARNQNTRMTLTLSETEENPEVAALQNLTRTESEDLVYLNDAKISSVMKMYLSNDLALLRPVGTAVLPTSSDAFVDFVNDPMIAMLNGKTIGELWLQVQLVPEAERTQNQKDIAAAVALILEKDKEGKSRYSSVDEVPSSQMTTFLARARGARGAPGMPQFSSVLEEWAARDVQGRPLIEYFRRDFATDLLCAWVVIPLTNADGVVEYQSVAVMLNDPAGANRSAITPDACRKAEEFLAMNSKHHRPMIRIAGSLGFNANDLNERAGIEDMGKRAMDEVIRYQGAMWTLEWAEDSGGARIFMASMTLGNDGHIATDAIDHWLVRLAALPPRATAAIRLKGDLLAIKSDSARDAELTRLAEITKPSGTPQRALSKGAVENVLPATQLGSAASAGLMRAEKRRQAYLQTESFLPSWGISYAKKTGEGGEALFVISQGTARLSFNSAELVDWIREIEKAKKLSAVMGVELQIDAGGRVGLPGQEKLAADEFIKQNTMLAAKSTQRAGLFGLV